MSSKHSQQAMFWFKDMNKPAKLRFFQIYLVFKNVLKTLAQKCSSNVFFFVFFNVILVTFECVLKILKHSHYVGKMIKCNVPLEFTKMSLQHFKNWKLIYKCTFLLFKWNVSKTFFERIFVSWENQLENFVSYAKSYIDF